ncbi:unnamed protein product [Vitrella brassicaformis CCMP3155]|uniref:Uncharacterized protein n=1 Tax=Vitrella brassicaformis (strain CCMP3155) TaxID=1169540 RepID=A0A0G4GET8_VITBC|nr:unnamed protein product [Vitrella brassicaformis CCMP3155]|eukprot:CEM27694.1 unnamed protein product [Vitrella brassicaformis CCMP3155]
MDVNQSVANARAVKDSLALLLDQDPATIAAQASSPEAWLVNHQLGSIAPLLSTLTSRLQQGGPSPTSTVAVDAHTATTDAAAAASGAAYTEPQARVVSGPSYRLVHQSGNPPPVNQGPACRRLSRDELAKVFGHLQPWELTRHRRPLGTPLFHQSAANYTHLVIDCKDDTARQMWETMPLAVALRWGERATNAREIKHRHPKWHDLWCRGTWVALVEGHSSGLAAIADKKRREREGGEGTADAEARDDDRRRSADESTLEVLAFEQVELDRSIRIPYPPPSWALPAAPSTSVRLPALKTVDNIPNPFLSARVGRKWRTPAVKTLITEGAEGGREWVEGAKALQVLDLAHDWDADDVAGVLSELPADGKSLQSLRTLRGIRLLVGTHADIDRLREVLVARGVRQSIRELEIDMRWMLSIGWTVERCQSVAQLIDAVADPEAVKKGVFKLSNDGTRGRIDAELLSLSSSGPAAAEKLIRDFAKKAGSVTYSGEDEAHPAAITDDTFPAAHTLQLLGHALADEAKKKRAVEIASHMPSLSRIDEGSAADDGVVLHAPVRDLWRWLERLHVELVRRGKERRLTLGLELSPSAFLEPLSDQQSPCLWGWDSPDKLPPIETVYVNIDGTSLPEDDDRHRENAKLKTFYRHVMAMLTSFNQKLKGHKRTEVRNISRVLGPDFERRFLDQQASLNFSGGAYEFSIANTSLTVERRDAAGQSNGSS